MVTILSQRKSARLKELSACTFARQPGRSTAARRQAATHPSGAMNDEVIEEGKVAPQHVKCYLMTRILMASVVILCGITGAGIITAAFLTAKANDHDTFQTTTMTADVIEKEAEAVDAPTTNPPTKRKYNVLLLWMLIDDVSIERFSESGNTALEGLLPGFDELKADGAIFYDHLYAPSSICAPAQASIFSGMDPARIGAQHQFAGDNIEGLRKYQSTPPPEVEFMPEILRQAEFGRSEGYWSTGAGKLDYQVGDVSAASPCDLLPLTGDTDVLRSSTVKRAALGSARGLGSCASLGRAWRLWAGLSAPKERGRVPTGCPLGGLTASRCPRARRLELVAECHSVFFCQTTKLPVASSSIPLASQYFHASRALPSSRIVPSSPC
eukprot:scaffold18452_cov64-Phaeocystis_antarctica.AAC.5